MKIPGYNINLENAVKQIQDKGYKQVVLQIPEGLKSHYVKFIDFIENATDTNIIISADPCFGACDQVNSDYKNMNIDFIIQIGHTPIPNIKEFPVPTIFVNAVADLDITNIVENSISKLIGKKSFYSIN